MKFQLPRTSQYCFKTGYVRHQPTSDLPNFEQFLLEAKDDRLIVTASDRDFRAHQRPALVEEESRRRCQLKAVPDRWAFRATFISSVTRMKSAPCPARSPTINCAVWTLASFRRWATLGSLVIHSADQ